MTFSFFDGGSDVAALNASVADDASRDAQTVPSSTSTAEERLQMASGIGGAGTNNMDYLALGRDAVRLVKSSRAGRAADPLFATACLRLRALAKVENDTAKRLQRWYHRVLELRQWLPQMAKKVQERKMKRAATRIQSRVARGPQARRYVAHRRVEWTIASRKFRRLAETIWPGERKAPSRGRGGKCEEEEGGGNIARKKKKVAALKRKTNRGKIDGKTLRGEGIESEGVHGGGELEQNVEHDRSDDEFLAAVAESSTGGDEALPPDIPGESSKPPGTSGHRKE